MATLSTVKSKDLEKFKKLFGRSEPRISCGVIEFRVSELDSAFIIAERIIKDNNLKLKIGGKDAQLRSFTVEIIKN